MTKPVAPDLQSLTSEGWSQAGPGSKPATHARTKEPSHGSARGGRSVYQVSGRAVSEADLSEIWRPGLTVSGERSTTSVGRLGWGLDFDLGWGSKASAPKTAFLSQENFMIPAARLGHMSSMSGATDGGLQNQGPVSAATSGLQRFGSACNDHPSPSMLLGGGSHGGLQPPSQAIRTQPSRSLIMAAGSNGGGQLGEEQGFCAEVAGLSAHASASMPYTSPQHQSAAQTVGQHLAMSVIPADGPGPGRVLLFRGLRVRMGLHTSMQDASSQVVYNRSAGRTQYCGALASVTKAVQDAAQGGMVLLSEATKQHVGAACVCRSKHVQCRQVTTVDVLCMPCTKLNDSPPAL